MIGPKKRMEIGFMARGYKEFAKDCTFWFMPVEDFDKEELIGIIGFLLQREQILCKRVKELLKPFGELDDNSGSNKNG